MPRKKKTGVTQFTLDIGPSWPMLAKAPGERSSVHYEQEVSKLSEISRMGSVVRPPKLPSLKAITDVVQEIRRDAEAPVKFVVGVSGDAADEWDYQIGDGASLDAKLIHQAEAVVDKKSDPREVAQEILSEIVNCYYSSEKSEVPMEVQHYVEPAAPKKVAVRKKTPPKERQLGFETVVEQGTRVLEVKQHGFGHYLLGLPKSSVNNPKFLLKYVNQDGKRMRIYDKPQMGKALVAYDRQHPNKLRNGDVIRTPFGSFEFMDGDVFDYRSGR